MLTFLGTKDNTAPSGIQGTVNAPTGKAICLDSPSFRFNPRNTDASESAKGPSMVKDTGLPVGTQLIMKDVPDKDAS